MGTRSTYAKPQVRKLRIPARSGWLRRIPVLTTLGEDLGNTARQTWADSGRSGQYSWAKEKAPRMNAWSLNLLLSKLKSFLLVRSRRTRNFAARWLICRAQPHCCSSAAHRCSSEPKAHACCLGTRPVVSRHGNRASLANSYAGQLKRQPSKAKPAQTPAKPAS